MALLLLLLLLPLLLYAVLLPLLPQMQPQLQPGMLRGAALVAAAPAKPCRPAAPPPGRDPAAAETDVLHVLLPFPSLPQMRHPAGGSGGASRVGDNAAVADLRARRSLPTHEGPICRSLPGRPGLRSRAPPPAATARRTTRPFPALSWPGWTGRCFVGAARGSPVPASTLV